MRTTKIAPFRLHPVLWLIYGFIRALAIASIFLFYRRRLVLGTEHLRIAGAGIVVSNHPSTLMDVLHVGIHVPRVMFFLANYSLFKNPISNWILSRLYCIPVKRTEDVSAGEARNIDATFEACFQHLDKGGILYVAPEGTSWMERLVRELKTGTARIGLGAMARNDALSDLCIYPVGLSYYAANLFRSDMIIHAGTPIRIADWLPDWQKDKVKTVKHLTDHLEQTLRTLSIHAHDAAGEQMLTRLEEMAHNTRPLDIKGTYERSQYFVKNLLPQASLREDVHTYYAALEEANLPDAAVAAKVRAGESTHQWLRGLVLLCGFPIFALGYALWFLPCFLPWLLAKRLQLYIGYDSTVKVLAGIFTLGAFFWALYAFTTQWVYPPYWAWGAIPVVLLLGYLAERYLDVWHAFWYSWQRTQVPDALHKQRQALITRFL